MTLYLDDYTRCVSGDIDYATNFVHPNKNSNLVFRIIYKLALKNVFIPIPTRAIYYLYEIVPKYRCHTPAVIKSQNFLCVELTDHDRMKIVTKNIDNYLYYCNYLSSSIIYLHKIYNIWYGEEIFALGLSYINKKYLYLLDQYQYLPLINNDWYVKKYFLNKISIDTKTYKFYLSCRGACAFYIGIMNEYKSVHESKYLYYKFIFGNN